MLFGNFISLLQDTTEAKCNSPSKSIPWMFTVRQMRVPVARIITTFLDHAYVSIVGPLIMYIKKKINQNCPHFVYTIYKSQKLSQQIELLVSYIFFRFS